MNLAYESGQTLLANFFSARRNMSVQAVLTAFRSTRHEREQSGMLATDEIESLLSLINAWMTKVCPFGPAVGLRHLAVALRNVRQESPAIPVWLLTQPFIESLDGIHEKPLDQTDNTAVVFCRKVLAFCLGYYGTISGFSKLALALDAEAWYQGLERRAMDYPTRDARYILGDRLLLPKLRQTCQSLLYPVPS